MYKSNQNPNSNFNWNIKHSAAKNRPSQPISWNVDHLPRKKKSYASLNAEIYLNKFKQKKKYFRAQLIKSNISDSFVRFLDDFNLDWQRKPLEFTYMNYLLFVLMDFVEKSVKKKISSLIFRCNNNIIWDGHVHNSDCYYLW